MTFIGNNHPRGSFVLLVLFGLLFLPGLAEASDSKRDEWPQWRGPRRDGKVSSFAAAWPDSLDESRLQPLWRVSLGPSYSNKGSELILLAADPKELKVLDRRKISEDETWGHLAVCGGKLFVRELGAASTHRWGGTEDRMNYDEALTTCRMRSIIKNG